MKFGSIRQRPILAVIMALIFLVTLLTTASTARAGDAAFNIRQQYLTGSPRATMPMSCVSRTIYLAAGNYIWTQVVPAGNSGDQRKIYLTAGTYGWKDCLGPKDYYYYHFSTLNPPWGQTAFLSSNWSTYSGTQTWGSYLAPA